MIIDGKPVYFEAFHKIGIMHINDLFIKNTSLESFNYWVNKGLHSSFWLQWHSLYSASTKFKQISQFKQVTSNAFAISTSDKGKIEIKHNFRSKDFYTVIMHEKGIVWPASKERLIRDFCLDENKLCSYFVLMHELKTENKVKDLQYRICEYNIYI